MTVVRHGKGGELFFFADFMGFGEIALYFLDKNTYLFYR
jgi:hypothetical protein